MGVKGRRKGVTTMVRYTCKWCGKETEKRRGSQGRMVACSRLCAGRYTTSVKRAQGKLRNPKNAVELSCATCGVAFQRWKSNVDATGNNYCTLKCKRRFYADRWRQLSARVREKHGNRCVQCGSDGQTDVHHIDGDHSHNAFENLTLLCRKCHCGVHIQMRGGLTTGGRPATNYNRVDTTKF